MAQMIYPAKIDEKKLEQLKSIAEIHSEDISVLIEKGIDVVIQKFQMTENLISNKSKSDQYQSSVAQRTFGIYKNVSPEDIDYAAMDVELEYDV